MVNVDVGGGRRGAGYGDVVGIEERGRGGRSVKVKREKV